MAKRLMTTAEWDAARQEQLAAAQAERDAYRKALETASEARAQEVA